MIPGEIYCSKKLDGSPSNWTFKFCISERPVPLVGVFIAEEAAANKIDLNKVRIKFGLTRRETDVLRRVLNGLKNIDIADELEISEQTVKDHLSNIYLKTGVENRFSLLNFLFNAQESQPG
jgi:DNA-binding NarL/FixJ family response regulator